MSDDTARLKAALQQPEKLLPPEVRLEVSRSALRSAMTPVPPPARPEGRPLVDKLGLSSSVDSVLAHPVVATLRDTVEQWWRTNRWRPIVTVAIGAVNQMAVPLARKHPYRLLGIAMLGGAILSRLKPWKWLAITVVPTLLASMLPTLISRVATRLPLSTLLELLGAGDSGRFAAHADPTRPVPTVAP